ncbi:hypothetical protein SteCoe_24198 [Stentor coeruleus]|uniref:Uncharacterized protein n=1 Tax=Stentor coeruleus TaxID=5963 RepID=A0A1R2BI67_9CILI|nr:hypothetical protein SteCoe_24198 [Stentor coeruleus]
MSGLKLNIPLPENTVQVVKAYKTFTKTLVGCESEIIQDINANIVPNVSFFHSMANKCSQQNKTLSFLNELTVDSNLNILMIYEILENISYNLSSSRLPCNVFIGGFLNFDDYELDSLKIFNENEQLQMFNDQVFDQEPEDAMGDFPDLLENLPVSDNEKSEVIFENSKISDNLEEIDMLSDYNYTKKNHKKKKKNYGKKTCFSSKKRNANEIKCQISDDNIKEEIIIGENQISKYALEKWNNKSKEIEIDSEFSKDNFYNQFTKPFTDFASAEDSFGDRNEFFIKPEILNDSNDNLLEDESFEAIISLKQLKKKIQEYIEIASDDQLELNNIKIKTAENINPSLFFVSILHICTERNFIIDTIENLFYIRKQHLKMFFIKDVFY